MDPIILQIIVLVIFAVVIAHFSWKWGFAKGAEEAWQDGVEHGATEVVEELLRDKIISMQNGHIVKATD